MRVDDEVYVLLLLIPQLDTFSCLLIAVGSYGRGVNGTDQMTEEEASVSE